MSTELDHLEAMAAALEASGRYRVLRKLAERSALTQVDPSWRVGLFVDVETTGLSARDHEIIELAMTRFFYCADDGVIHGLGESFQRFREPSEPISDEVTRITGITDAMVAGHTIDASEVASFSASASFVAAHNASSASAMCFAPSLGLARCRRLTGQGRATKASSSATSRAALVSSTTSIARCTTAQLRSSCCR